jgi:hypothetical protein
MVCNFCLSSSLKTIECFPVSDMELSVQHVHLVRKMINQEPFKSAVDRELDPGPDTVTNAQIRGKYNFAYFV